MEMLKCSKTWMIQNLIDTRETFIIKNKIRENKNYIVFITIEYRTIGIFFFFLFKSTIELTQIYEG